MMRRFASYQSSIAFEGKLITTELYSLEGASHDETDVLKRATIVPRLDFVVLPLDPTRIPEFQKAIQSKIAFSEHEGIVHVQIETNGEIVFGAYDNFGSVTVVVNGNISTDVLDHLVKDRTLRSYFIASRTVTLDDLLVALADNCWKGKRIDELETKTVDFLSSVSGKPEWDCYAALDDILGTLAADADGRLEWQRQFGTQQTELPT